MRVISGVLKGFNIKTPKCSATRPATELVRGAMFSILEHLLPAKNRILDLFAGSGALSLEALSRGFEHAVLVEHEAAVCRIAKENLQRAGMESCSQVLCMRAEKALKILSEPFDVIMMDPPYRKEELGEFLETLLASVLVKDSTILVVNHSVRQELADTYGRYERKKQSRHGDSIISVYLT